MRRDLTATELIDGFFDGTLDEADLTAHKRLLQTDPTLREAMATEFRLRGLIRSIQKPSQLEARVTAAIDSLSPEGHEGQILRAIGKRRRDWLPRSWFIGRGKWAFAGGLTVIVGLAICLSLLPTSSEVTLASGWRFKPTGSAVYHVLQPDRVRLDRGELFVESVASGARSPLAIETPGGLATAKGTSFFIGVHADTTTMTRVLVLTGLVTMTNAHGEEVGKANELLVAEPGKPPVSLAIAANSDFAVKLYGQLAKEKPGKNLFFSPYSMSSALAMTAEGARGETAEQMGNVLGFPPAARHIGNDTQLLPWNTALIHTGMAELNERFKAKPVPQELRDKIAAMQAEFEASKVKAAEFLAASNNNERDQYFLQYRDLSQEQADTLNAMLLQTDQSQLHMANMLLGEKMYPFKREYLETINKFYGTGAAVPVDFKNNFGAVRQQINTNVADFTNQRIQHLIESDGLDESTRLVLVNAIYFKGEWSVPFEEGATKPEDFFAETGKKVSVMMMRKDFLAGARYGAFNANGSVFATPDSVLVGHHPDARPVYPDKGGFLVVELPYKGNELSMVVIVPQDAGGLGALEARLSSAKLQAWLGELKERKVNVQMPKFKVETNYQQMAESLQAMGMVRAFNDPRDPVKGAQFDGMCASSDPIFKLYVSKVVHKAFVEVTEKGTEAAAATAVNMLVPTFRPMRVPFTPTFRADKPFLFAIRDVKTASILFLGRIVNPNE